MGFLSYYQHRHSQTFIPVAGGGEEADYRSSQQPEHTVYDVKEEEVEKVSYTLIHSQSPIPGSIGSTPGLKDND